MQRVISGVVLAVAALAAIWFLPAFFLRVLACVVAALAASEYLKITGGHQVGVLGAVAVCSVLSSGQLAVGYETLAWVMVGFVVICVLFCASTIQAASVTAFASAYLGLPLGLLVVIQTTWGPRATLFLLASIVVSDTSQYYSGRTFGRHPLAPAISPKKTIEGAIGGVLIGTAFVAIAAQYLFGLKPLITIPFGVAVVVLGILGDLFESRLKRVAGVKDSSNLIPGHGGVLDRIDALLFAVPAFYFMLVRSLT